MSGDHNRREPLRIIFHNGNALVWNIKDWLTLRKEHGILGNLIGCISHLPRQDIINGLPMKLLPEEVTLILQKNIGKVYTYKNPYGTRSLELQAKYASYLEKVKKEQIECYEEKRKKEVLGMLDRIIEGKKRKLSNKEIINIDKEAILKTELEKTNENLAENVFTQIPTVDPWFNEEDFVFAKWDYPKTPKEKLKYRIFKDLIANKHYFITSGSKFGGDFLVYPGEPIKFHAFFIVICVLPETNLSLLDIIMHARLGTMTKKTFVIASINKYDEITYSSFEWTSKS
uniref:tRNA-splicing endonuclease subunit Sen34 n=1 Tax=Triatoma infestans TaxID=30076 RepID=A0A023F816_TRIIF